MNIKYFLNKIKRRMVGDFSEDIESMKKRGVTIGENPHFYHTQIDYGYGFLVEIGNNVTLTNNIILAHDASTKCYLGYSKVGKVKIGDNVFAGFNSIILPGVTIGSNVVIGAGAVVRDNIPDNSVVAGNPGKVICSLDEYISKNKNKMGTAPVFEKPWSKMSIDEKERMKELLSNSIGYNV